MEINLIKYNFWRMMRIASSRGVLPLGIMLNGSQNYYKIKLLIRNEKICAYYFYLKKNRAEFTIAFGLTT